MKRSLFDGSSWSRLAPQGKPGTPHQQKPFCAAGELKPHRTLLPMIFHFNRGADFLSHDLIPPFCHIGSFCENILVLYLCFYILCPCCSTLGYLISLLSPHKAHTIFFVLIKSHFVSSALCLFIGESLIHNVFWHLIWLIPFAKHSVLLWKKREIIITGKTNILVGGIAETLWPSQLSTEFAWSWDIYKSVIHGGVFKNRKTFFLFIINIRPVWWERREINIGVKTALEVVEWGLFDKGD